MPHHHGFAHPSGRRYWTVGILVALAIASAAPTADTQVRRVSGRCAVYPLPDGVHEISGTDPVLPPTDLAPLDTIIGAAEIVALGESVHGSGGFSEAKHRLFRYLVEQHGFRVFAFESPWSGAELVADHVRDGAGTSASTVRDGLFGVWQCVEVVELIEWMRHYNLTHPDDPVSFFGFDVQQPAVDGAKLITFLEQVVHDSEGLVTGVSACSGVGHASWIMNETDHTLCIDALVEIETIFTDSPNQIIAASSAEDLEWAWINLLALRANEGLKWGYWTNDIEAAYALRDAGMAEVFKRIRNLRHRNEKTAIWAHNWHIAAATDEWQHNADMGAAPSMGTLLADELGDDYVAIALSARTTRFWWPWIDSIAQVFVADDGVEFDLYRLGRGSLLVDLSNTDLFTIGEISGWMWPHYGADFVWYWWTIDMVAADNFDALVLLDDSPAMTPLEQYPLR